MHASAAQAGRAGRDGLSAKCIMLYAPEDVLRIASVAVDDVERVPGRRGGTQPKVLGMVKYCHAKLCRREMFARSFYPESPPTGLGTSAEPSSSAAAAVRSCMGGRGGVASAATSSSSSSTAVQQPAQQPMSMQCDNCIRRALSLIDTDTDTGNTKQSLAAEVRAIAAAVEGCIQQAAAAATGGMLTLKKLAAAPAVKKAAKGCGEASSAIEYTVAGMLSQHCLSIQYNFTPYKTQVYLKAGYNFHGYVLDGDYISSYFILPPAPVTASSAEIDIAVSDNLLRMPEGGADSRKRAAHTNAKVPSMNKKPRPSSSNSMDDLLQSRDFLQYSASEGDGGCSVAGSGTGVAIPPRCSSAAAEAQSNTNTNTDTDPKTSIIDLT
jgi:hypothetical protein